MSTDKSESIGESSVLCRFCGLFFNSHKELGHHVDSAHNDDSLPQIAEPLPKTLLEIASLHFVERAFASDLSMKKDSNSNVIMPVDLLTKLPSHDEESSSNTSTKQDSSSHAPDDSGDKYEDNNNKTQFIRPKVGRPVSRVKNQHRCTHCNKNFRSKSSLTDHVRIHTGEKPFKCPSCPARFTQVSNRNRHMMTHDPTYQPFTCHICMKGFVRRVTLLSHQRIHARRYPFRCNICDVSYTNLGELERHASSSTCFR